MDALLEYFFEAALGDDGVEPQGRRLGVFTVEVDLKYVGSVPECAQFAGGEAKRRISEEITAGLGPQIHQRDGRSASHHAGRRPRFDFGFDFARPDHRPAHSVAIERDFCASVSSSAATE